MALKLRRKRGIDSSLLGEQTIETLLVVDQKMMQYHGLDAAKQYVLTIANIVSKLIFIYIYLCNFIVSVCEQKCVCPPVTQKLSVVWQN